MEVKVDSSPSNALALTNQVCCLFKIWNGVNRIIKVFLNPQEANVLIAGAPENTITKERNYLQLKNQIYTFRFEIRVLVSPIYLNVFSLEHMIKSYLDPLV